MTPINSGFDQAEPTDWQRAHEHVDGTGSLRTTEQVMADRYERLDRRQYEADKAQAISAVRRLCGIATGTVQGADSEQAHTEAMAIGRLIARLETRHGR
jgi:hypothetical protein